MGIQDRDYYRNDGPSIFDQMVPRGLVCRWLIGINVAAFLVQLITLPASDGRRFSDGAFTDWLILDVGAVLHGEVWRLLTYSFLHSTDANGFFLHVFFNMLFLWWFGSDVEEIYGRREFLAIYLVSAVLGGAVYELWALSTGGTARCLGASGAVTTMLILCALHTPKRTILLFGIAPIPIWLFALFNVLRDFIGFLGVGEQSVAFCVHLAGAGFALGYYKWQGGIVETLRGILWWKPGRARTRLKLFDPDEDREEPVAVAAGASLNLNVDEHLEAKCDAILEKMQKLGKASLTPKEEEILKQAAEMYKRRRN
jgi:membrane associated rhomboid family serine protease